MNTQIKFSGNIVDVVSNRIIKGSVYVENGIISNVVEEDTTETRYILPGLIDAHIHIESSMLIPSEFAKMAVVHGTVATVSDPHEIANVMGIEGVKFMIRNGKKVPFKFFFGAPSCVPATPFETSGARLGVKETEELLQMEDIHYLSEMMNYPGVLFEDKEVLAKLALAQAFDCPVDGHAPGVMGEKAGQYAQAGISTDHECSTLAEAEQKLAVGMKILIREGSAARNFDALHSLISRYPERVMLCSDDKHPDDLLAGHINQLTARALTLGHNIFDVLRSACINPVYHYGLSVGQLKVGECCGSERFN